MANLRVIAPEAEVAVWHQQTQPGAAVPADCECHLYSLEEALGFQPDAALVCSPSSLHVDNALPFAQTGVHLLVEKPLALHEVEARKLAGTAVSNGLILQVGHQERFVAKAMGMFRIEEPPLSLESVRYSPPSPEGRAGDVSVIWDLMIHDLDLAGCLRS